METGLELGALTLAELKKLVTEAELRFGPDAEIVGVAGAVPILSVVAPSDGRGQARVWMGALNLRNHELEFPR